KKLSAVEAVQAYIARITAVNPKLNAVVQTCFERALKEAKEADALASGGRFKGPLHGVPMTIKDSIDTEGVISTGGTVGRMNYVPKKEATVVAGLRGRSCGGRRIHPSLRSPGEALRVWPQPLTSSTGFHATRTT